MSETLPTRLKAAIAARYAVSACDIWVTADAMLASSVLESCAVASMLAERSRARASSSARRSWAWWCRAAPR